MNRLTVQTCGIVLNRLPRGENSLRLHFLSPEHGRLILIKRLSLKRTTGSPDLFDCAEILAEAAETPSCYFLREYRLLKRHQKLGSDYQRLSCASQFAQLLDRNLTHAETFQHLYALALEAFEAWEEQPHPRATLLKALYRLAREEGYPVKEQWCGSLPHSLKPEALKLLNTPLQDLHALETQWQALIEHLNRWLEHHTDILV